MVNLKRFVVLFVLIFLFGCVSAAQFAALEKEVASLKAERTSRPSAMLLAEQAGAAKFHWRNTLQGNTSSSIDGITGASNGDAAMMVNLSSTTGTAYLYVYDSDGDYATGDYPASCTTECERLKADGMGAGTWNLVNWFSTKIIAAADDGYHYWQSANTDDLIVGEREDGRCWYSKTDNRIECYDGTNIQYWTASGTE